MGKGVLEGGLEFLNKLCIKGHFSGRFSNNTFLVHCCSKSDLKIGYDPKGALISCCCKKMLRHQGEFYNKIISNPVTFMLNLSKLISRNRMKLACAAFRIYWNPRGMKKNRQK